MQNIKEIGVNAGEISTHINLFQLYYHFLIYVVDYIHFKRTNIFEDQDLTNDDVNYLTNNILNFLQMKNALNFESFFLLLYEQMLIT